MRYIIFANVPVLSTTDGDAYLVTHTIVSFALPCSRQVTMRVTFHRRRIYIRAPANGGSGIDAYGWLPTTEERIVTSRIVHVAAACNDRSPVAAAGTIRADAGHDRPEFLRVDASRRFARGQIARSIMRPGNKANPICTRRDSSAGDTVHWRDIRIAGARRLRWRMKKHDRLEAHRVE